MNIDNHFKLKKPNTLVVDELEPEAAELPESIHDKKSRRDRATRKIGSPR